MSELFERGCALTPVMIFLAEVVVVTISTLRIIFVAQGRKYLAPCLGFFEILTWLFAIGQVMQNLEDPACFVAFALGFTLGNYLGILLEKWLALGTLVVRIITHRDAGDLVRLLRGANYGVTCVEGSGAKGPVQMVFTVIKRRQLEDLEALIRQAQPQAFYTIDDCQAAAGIFAASRPSLLPFALPWSRKKPALSRSERRQCAYSITE